VASGPIVNDRSFASLPTVVGAMSKGPLGALIGVMGFLLPTVMASMCSVLGGHVISPMCHALQLVLPVAFVAQVYMVLRQGDTLLTVLGCLLAILLPLLCTYFQSYTIAVITERCLTAEVVGVVLGFSGLLASPISILCSLLGWDLNAAQAWKKLSVPKCIIFHKCDGVIDYYRASTHTFAHANGGMQGTYELELTYGSSKGPHQVCHMYPLDKNTREWKEVVHVVCQMLSSGSLPEASPRAYRPSFATSGRAVSMQQGGVIQRGGGQHIPLVDD